MFIVQVNNRRKETLQPLINDHIRFGTRIISDAWVSYTDIDEMPNGYGHDVINHTHHYVLPQYPDIHTNTIEGLWGNSKKKLKRLNGTSRLLFQSHIDEFVWRWRNDALSGKRVLGKFILAVNEQYN